MGLEVGTYISDLVVTNPVGATDPKSQGDDHLRLLKATIKASFPNITGAMTATHTQLNLLATDGAGAGIVADLAAKADPGADQVLGWDESANAAIGFTLTAPLAFNGTAIELTNAAGIVTDLAALADPGADRFFGWDESADAAIAFSPVSGELLFTTTTVGVGANIPKLDASNVFLAVQNLTLAGAGSPYITLGYSGATKAYLGVAHTAGAVSAGAAAGDLILRAEAGGLVFTGNAGASASLTLSSAGLVTTPNASASEVGYKGVPQNSQSVDYTLVLADAGKHLYQSGSSKTFTIPANASVAFPIGTPIAFYTHNAACSIAITSDTLILAGTGTTGTRTLATGGLATALKIAATTWVISGAGLS